MKNKELYDKTVDILVQAYFNDALESWDCTACAVGNIVAANMGYRRKDGFVRKWIDKNGQEVDVAWSEVHTISFGETAMFEGCYKGLAKQQIDSTGYSFKETALIESAFEKGYGSREDNGHNINPKKMFNGLMAVIDVLDQIHKNTDGEATNKTKQRFQKQLA
jgi:hypothetical protein